MTARRETLAPGLYLVATPIGSARDITLRALDVLASADVIAAEDTRTARKLMSIHGIDIAGRKVIAYHDHSSDQAAHGIVALIGQGQSVAYVSEAGTPLVADPGFELVRSATEQDLMVTSAPGPSAIITALSIAGLPTDRFLFAGFLPNAKSARRTALSELAGVPATLVFYESPKRIQKSLTDMVEVLGDRQAALCRELTKKFEEVRRGSISQIIDSVIAKPPKGEIVILIDRDRAEASEEDLNAMLAQALETMSLRDAADSVAGTLNIPRRTAYQAALALSKKS